MITKYSIRKAAADDIEEILDFISADNPRAALNFFDRFQELFEMISQMPKMGVNRPELGYNIRSVAEKSYTIYFQLTDFGLEIIRVLHNARDINSNMFQ